MRGEVDRRAPVSPRAPEAQRAALERAAEQLSDSLHGRHRLVVERIDPLSGGVERLRSVDALARAGDLVGRALEHLDRVGPVLTEAGDALDFVPDRRLQMTSAGTAAVHLQQQHQGIPIFQATETVWFDRAGAVTDVIGRAVPLPARTAPSEPSVSADEALRVLLRQVAMAIEEERESATVDQFGQPMARPVLDPELEASGLGVNATLTWFPVADELRLGWQLVVALPDHGMEVVGVVDASDGSILYMRDTVTSVQARANVYRLHGGGVREMTDLPPPMDGHWVPVAPGLPADYPRNWVATDRTEGYFAYAHVEDEPAALGSLDSSGALVFDAPDAGGCEQLVANVFYAIGYMHDLFYLLGFREAEGNFQQDNFGRGGAAGDRLEVRVVPGPIPGTATMLTPIDGQAPVIRLGLVGTTGRHTALDAGIVFHEYVHGVSSRLVGGPANKLALLEPQSRGMAEGWSDYVACTVNSEEVIGAWVVADAAGLRRYPYSDAYPEDFGALGSGAFDGSSPYPVGEVWCAILCALTRGIGRPAALALVVDALKMTPANPSFVDGRDALLAALAGQYSAGAISSATHVLRVNEVWSAFARFGVGRHAASNGALVEGNRADYCGIVESIAAIAATPSGGGYWLAAADGTVLGFGDAVVHEAPGAEVPGAEVPAQPVVAMAATPSGAGYWLAAADGTVLGFGDAVVQQASSVVPTQQVVAMAATPSGAGYWLASRDGMVVAVGDAVAHPPGTGGAAAQPIVAMVATSSGAGYWLAAADGTVIGFGDAAVHPPSNGATATQPIVAMAACPSGTGYWLVTADGTVLGFGDAVVQPPAGDQPASAPIVAIAASPSGAGYWLAAADGHVMAPSASEPFGYNRHRLGSE